VLTELFSDVSSYKKHSGMSSVTVITMVMYIKISSRSFGGEECSLPNPRYRRA